MKQMLKYILSLITTQQQYAEQKHSFILALNSGIIVVTVGFFNNSGTLVLVLNFLSIFLCGISLCINLFALYSRKLKTLKVSNANKNIRLNLLYYGNICQYNEDEYLNAIKLNYNFPIFYTFDEFERDLSRQIIINSSVVLLKHKLFNRSLLFLFAGIVCALSMFALISVGI